MKKIYLTIIIIGFLFTSAFSQFGGNEEYRYLSIKAGFTNSFLDNQPDSIGSKFLKSPYGDIQLIPDKNYFGYTTGYYGSIHYNYDLESGNDGLVVGASYNSYGISAKYHTPNENYWLIENQYVSNVSFPVYIKLGKDYYDKQFYVYAGGSYDMNILLRQTEEVGWKTDILNTELDKNMLLKKNISGIFGINYMFLNIEANYVFGGFLNKDYQLLLYDGQQTVKPFEKFPNKVLYIKAGLTIPLNSWTPRQIYSLEKWFRKVFK